MTATCSPEWRIKRLLPDLSGHGMELVVDQQWGLATYRTHSGAQETSRLTSVPTA
ncbi:hypothetical protein KUF83_28305 [Streptomyces sp. BV286]|uniref:hypothetical protein n=1 Tax=Streptomyces sp. BV286 TaxID=2849672 RepID=UPI001C2F05C4|nr:hypothetical protein [Streptomyces sp. BV286]MBV1940442.1 hypothetical protein [Streptomyces sp. BV286]